MVVRAVEGAEVSVEEEEADPEVSARARSTSAEVRPLDSRKATFLAKGEL